MSPTLFSLLTLLLLTLFSCNSQPQADEEVDYDQIVLDEEKAWRIPKPDPQEQVR